MAGSIIFFLLNICIGSFLNTLIYRIPRKIDFLKGRSFCPKCKNKIVWYDNIPVLSFILLKGKCRKCHSPIPWRYLLVELLTGVLSTLTLVIKFRCHNLSNWLCFFDFLCYLFFLWGLIVIFFIDLDWRIIPDEVVFPLTFIFLIRTFLLKDWGYLLSGLGAFVFLLAVFLVTKGKGMGFGDVKLAFLKGLALGWPNIVVSFYIAFLTGALVGIILILTKKAKFGQKIPFGPFLAGAGVVNLIWGEKMGNFLFKVIFLF